MRNKFSVKGLRTCRGQEGEAYSCSLYFDGKKMADVEDGAFGGDPEFHFENDVMEKIWNEYVKALPEKMCFGTLLSYSDGMAMEEILDDLKMRKLCKKKTAFKLKGQEGEYYTMNVPFDVEVKKGLVSKYGEKLDVIFNETFA